MTTVLQGPPPLPPGPTTRAAAVDLDAKTITSGNVKASEETRNGFKVVLDLRRASLTKQEVGFLEGLLHGGTEQEVSMAKKRLSDPNLFPADSTSDEEEEDDEEEEKGDGNNDRQLTKKSSGGSGIDLTSSFGSTGAGASTKTADVGSARRRESLSIRKNSVVHGQMWKAHQNGLAVSRQASRRSILVKEQSISRLSFSSAAGRQSIGKNNNDVIRQSWQSSLTMMDWGSDCDLGDTTDEDSDDDEDTPVVIKPKVQERASFRPSMRGVSLLADFRKGSSRTSLRSSITSLRSSVTTTKRGSQASLASSIRRGSNQSIGSNASSGDATARRGSTLALAYSTSIGSDRPSIPNAAALRRLGSDRRLGLLQKSGSKRRVTVAGNETSADLNPDSAAAAAAASSAPRRHTVQTQRSVHDLMDDIPEGNEQESPKSTRRTFGETSFPFGEEDDREEKKMNDEEMFVAQQQQEQQEHDNWHLNLSVRRTSNSDLGEGMEVDFLHKVQEYNIGSESESEGEFEEEEGEEVEVEIAKEPIPSSSNHAMIMRRASVNIYNGEGMEIADWDLQEDLEEQRRESLENMKHSAYHLSDYSLPEEDEEESVAELVKSASFDELQSMDRLEQFPVLERGPGTLMRSYSDDELSAVLTAHMHHRAKEKRHSGATAATEEESDDDEALDDFEYDAWDNEINKGIGSLPFRILGTSADDVDSHPHVLSPPLMESIQAFMPFSKTSDNYWMRYSLVRDGASLYTLLQHARGAKYSVLAIETVDGEVMGSFTSEPWRKTWSYFGGGESFLWKMRNSRKTKCHSIIDIAQLESEIDVYPYTGENHCVQFCTSRQIAVGGGCPDQGKASMTSLHEEGSNSEEEVREHDWGYGIALQGDLLHGSSSPCVTFGSPSLSKIHRDGSLFEIMNIELWTLTPCYSEADAEKLELGKMFLEQQSFGSEHYQSNDELNEMFG